MDKNIPVLGFDEVGRGCLAGPVIVACVLGNAEICKLRPSGIIIRDSKKMSRSQRNISSKWIIQKFRHGFGEASVAEIDNYGIASAVNMAAKRAYLHFINSHPSLTNNVYSIKNDGREKWFDDSKAIIKGDDLIPEISMASIIAKVFRDTLMAKLDEKYVGWGFGQHVGYGTDLHRNLIRKYGLIDGLHRTSFCRKFTVPKI